MAALPGRAGAIASAAASAAKRRPAAWGRPFPWNTKARARQMVDRPADQQRRSPGAWRRACAAARCLGGWFRPSMC